LSEKKTATYKTVFDSGGDRFEFYCDLSGAKVCTSKKTYEAETAEQQLLLAWENEGKRHFNFCRKCGRFVIDAMFNPEVLECVECAPFETDARFCKNCGAKVEHSGRTCTSCGKRLNYEGGMF